LKIGLKKVHFFDNFEVIGIIHMDNNNLYQEYKDTYNQYIKIAELFQKDFHFYIETHRKILQQVSEKLAEPAENKFREIQKEIFQEEFCAESELEKKKNNFLKIFFETEKIRQSNKQLDGMEEVLDLCQKASKIIQKHWEFYQYKRDKITLDDIFSLFFQDVEEVLFLWDSFVIQLEVFSKFLVLSEKQVAKGKEGEKSLQIYFEKTDSQTVDLTSIENFIALIKKTKELITKIKPLEVDLRISNIQIRHTQIVVQILLSKDIAAIFQNIIMQLHIDKLQKDGLQKILISIFGSEVTRNIEKKVILNFQKQMKDLISPIQKQGNFVVLDKVNQWTYEKVFALLDKLKRSRKNGKNLNSKHRKFTRDLLFIKDTPAANASEATPSKDNPSKIAGQLPKEKRAGTDHVAYLTS
jgi:hypothetical protein